MYLNAHGEEVAGDEATPVEVFEGVVLISTGEASVFGHTLRTIISFV